MERKVVGKWKSKNRHKYLLQFQLIFVRKHRKWLLAHHFVSDDTKQLSRELSEKHGVAIKRMETDRDRILHIDVFALPMS